RVAGLITLEVKSSLGQPKWRLGDDLLLLIVQPILDREEASAFDREFSLPFGLEDAKHFPNDWCDLHRHVWFDRARGIRTLRDGCSRISGRVFLVRHNAHRRQTPELHGLVVRSGCRKTF